MRIISLTKGYVAKISNKDYTRAIAAGPWYALLTHNKVYACHKSRGKPTVLMHRFILGLTTSIQVDHRDGDGLNNQRHNIRKASHAQNQHNRKKPISNTSGILGVSFHKRTGKWRADLRINGKQLYLGEFSSKQHAKRIRQKAARQYHKTFASKVK